MDAGLRRLSHPFAAAWFDFWLRVFVFGIVGAIVTIALAPVPQMTILGIGTLACATLGMLVCVAGVRAYNPARWRAIRTYYASMGESLQSATEVIGEPHHSARARALASASSNSGSEP